MKYKRLLAGVVLLFSGLILGASSQKVEQLVSVLAEKAGLDPVKGLSLQFVSASQLEEQYLAEQRRLLPAAAIEEEGQLLKLLGVLGQDVDLVGQFERLTRGNIKAWYIPDTRTLMVDRALVFDDEYSLGPVAAAAWKALTAHLRVPPPAPAAYFTDDNLLIQIGALGEATFVMHRFFDDDIELFSSMDGMLSTTRNPLVNAAVGYDFDPLIKAFYTQSLLIGIRVTEEGFRKKEWKGLAAQLAKRETPTIGALLRDKSAREDRSYGYIQPPAMTGFSAGKGRSLGLFLLAFLLDRSPQEVWNGLGALGDGCGLYTDGESAGVLLRWESDWKTEDAARDVYLGLRDRFENKLACRFELGSRRDGPFLAGRDETGAYVFLFQQRRRTLLVRTRDRQAMNRFIGSGSFASSSHQLASRAP